MSRAIDLDGTFGASDPPDQSARADRFTDFKPKDGYAIRRVKGPVDMTEHGSSVDTYMRQDEIVNISAPRTVLGNATLQNLGIDMTGPWDDVDVSIVVRSAADTALIVYAWRGTDAWSLEEPCQSNRINVRQIDRLVRKMVARLSE